jgi:septal ring factor EnvC (AmiA/AmiB activator)
MDAFVYELMGLSVFQTGRAFRSAHLLPTGIFMKQQLEQRLNELKAEYASGQKALADLENKQAALKSTLLRISGAIQVLEEELSEDGKEENKTKPPIK